MLPIHQSTRRHVPKHVAPRTRQLTLKDFSKTIIPVLLKNCS